MGTLSSIHAFIYERVPALSAAIPRLLMGSQFVLHCKAYDTFLGLNTLPDELIAITLYGQALNQVLAPSAVYSYCRTSTAK